MTFSGVLADRDIHREVAEHSRNGHGLNIDPFNGENVQPASYDLTLGDEFMTTMDTRRGRHTVQSIKNGAAERETFVDDGIQIMPGGFVLGHTQETISLPNYITAEVKGRSSLGRMGIIPHTAGWIDPGFSGQITLEFVNHSAYPVELYAGDRVAQAVFTYTNDPAAEPYGEKENKYQGQTGVTGSRIEEDTDR